jgi:hypothetical protein
MAIVNIQMIAVYIQIVIVNVQMATVNVQMPFVPVLVSLIGLSNGNGTPGWGILHPQKAAFHTI